MIRRAAACPSLLLAAVLLAACGSGEPATSTSASTERTAASAGVGTPSPVTEDAATQPAGSDASAGATDTGGSPFEGSAGPVTQQASPDALVTVSEVRTGRQDGYDRVVLEMGGTGTPGWDVRYVDQAAAQGTGAPVELAGDAVLQVTVTGAGYPYDTGVQEWSGPDPLPGNGTRTVTEVAWDGTFEGTAVAFVGTTGEAPFRVYALADPTRLVVEVADLG